MHRAKDAAVAKSTTRIAGHRRTPEPWFGAVFLALAACQPAPPPASPPAVQQVAPVGRATQVAAAPVPPTKPALPSTDLPPGPIYYCETSAGRAPMTLPAGIEPLCRRHPEMGPCKYERSACRSRGGRVFTSKGEEVTARVEAAYDRRVTRVRLQADGAPAKR